MIYIDTSVLVPLLMPEARSMVVRAWFRRLDFADAAVSAWTIVEFASALGVKVRSRAASAEAAAHANAAFQRLARKSLGIVVPTHRDFLDATRYLEEFDLGLRGGDALHLAIARNRRASGLVTLDKGLARAAGRFGLACEMPA
jgi:uncharacterized protein